MQDAGLIEAQNDVAEPVREQVLFVDDEPHLLAGLRRMLHAERDHWDMNFVSSAAEALELFDRQPVDAIISDMRMPGMDGAQLLAHVQRHFPSTARIILSGQADRTSVIVAIRSAQQFLAKPCDAVTLTGAVTRALEVRRMLADPALRELIGGVSSLPTLPTVYHELVSAMDSPEIDLAAVAKILSSDVATSAEVLKLVNSAFFGLTREISTVDSAVSLLGLDNIQALVLTGSVFRMDTKLARIVNVEELRDMALRRAAIGRAIAIREGWPQHERNLAVLACMLRDVGALVLAEGMPKQAGELTVAVEAAKASGTATPAIRAGLEAAAYGCTIPQASAYLLGLWGFAAAMVQAVATQPLVRAGPGTARTEYVVDFAHQRALDPFQPVAAADDDEYLDANRVLVWNSASDEVLMA
jgi:HD-like signal output (HDOD) protein/ActR/RegA family two-component response regulator